MPKKKTTLEVGYYNSNQLRKFGFPYNEIKLIKNKITNYIPTDKLIKSVLEKKEELDEHIPKASNLIEKHKS